MVSGRQNACFFKLMVFQGKVILCFDILLERRIVFAASFCPCKHSSVNSFLDICC